MRHGLHHKKLNRTSEHRKSLIKNMLNSLIKYEQITTTLPKAKLLKPQIDKVITLGKKDSLTNMRNTIHKYEGIDLLVTYHPAALLRNPNFKKYAWEDFKLIRDKYSNV